MFVASLRDMADGMCDFQRDLKKWLTHNFPKATSDQQLKGIMEELGELCCADLKHEQGIRGYDEKRSRNEIKDAVGDIVIYLINYCSIKNIVFQDCIEMAYHEIKGRDWVKNPEKGKN